MQTGEAVNRHVCNSIVEAMQTLIREKIKRSLVEAGDLF
jgi:hypothetical protein